MDEKVELEIVGLTYTEHAQPTYVLILKEKNGTRRLPIVIGPFEAQAIALELDHLTPKRPITHDLTTNILKTFNINILEITIVKIQEDIFYAEITLEKDGSITRIDSRPSDAIALALRFKSPIYANKQVLDSAGIDMAKLWQAKEEEEKSEQENKTKSPEGEDYLTRLSIDELQKLMQKAIEEENYELASKIRDEIKRRKGEI